MNCSKEDKEGKRGWGRGNNRVVGQRVREEVGIIANDVRIKYTHTSDIKKRE